MLAKSLTLKFLSSIPARRRALYRDVRERRQRSHQLQSCRMSPPAFVGLIDRPAKLSRLSSTQSVKRTSFQSETVGIFNCLAGHAIQTVRPIFPMCRDVLWAHIAKTASKAI